MIKRFDHSGIVVNNLDTSIKFYIDTVGLTLRRRFKVPEFDLEVAFLGLGEKGGGSELELMKFENPEIPIGFRHLSLVVDDIDDYCKKIENKGAEITMKPQKISCGDIAIMFKDPDGITIEVLQKPQ